MQGNQLDSWNQAAPCTTPLPVVVTMEKREMRNARIAPNIPWNTTTYASVAPPASPSNYTTAAVITRSHNQPTIWNIAKPIPINSNLLYNCRQCAFSKKFDHNVPSKLRSAKLSIILITEFNPAGITSLVVDMCPIDRKTQIKTSLLINGLIKRQE